MPVTVFQELEFEDEQQEYEFKCLVAGLGYNTRVKEHNGHTPLEMMARIYFKWRS